MHIFAAYTNKDPLRAESIRRALTLLRERGVTTVSWEELSNIGSPMIDPICRAIRESEIVLAEVSVMNLNVLYEAGYAAAQGKQLWLALDETDVEVMKRWENVRFFVTLGSIFYGGNSDRLASQAIDESTPKPERDITINLLLNGSAREANTLFAPSLPHKFDAGQQLDRMLSRNRLFKLLGTGEDLGYAPMDYVTKLIYRSSATLIQLMAPTRNGALEHNARASFMAGFSHGLELPTLMVAEPGFESPLDYKDQLFIYDNSASLQRHVTAWIDNLPAPKSQYRPGRLNLRIELPLTSFGAYVAEDEIIDLRRYFVETSEFRRILEGRQRVLIGRKGTGKTATMLQAVQVLREDKRKLVVSIRPSTYEMSALQEALEQFKTEPKLEYFLKTVWTYLLLSEVAVHAVRYAAETPAGVGGDSGISNLKDTLDVLGIDTEEDLAARLDNIISNSRDEQVGNVATIAHRLRDKAIKDLRLFLPPVLKGYQRTAVLIDNLDKSWGPTTNHRLASKFILSLFETGQELEQKFSIEGRLFTVCIFLRSDIHDIMRKHALEPDKLGEGIMRWGDKELLLRVIEDRYSANCSRRSKEEPWSDLFDDEFYGMPANDYLLWRALPRPRDLIHLAGTALDTAVNRRHAKIQEVDAVFAESEYSKFAVDSLLVEGTGSGLPIEDAIYEFAGGSARFTASHVESLIESIDGGDSLFLWLVRNSFLGIELTSGEVVYPEGEQESRRRLRAARNAAETEGTELIVRVHPAYRPFLEVKDDDLHILATPQLPTT